MLTPAERAERKRERAAQKERDRLMSERITRDLAKRERERKERLIARRAAQAVAELHPEEMERETEAAQVYIALERGIPDPSFVTHRLLR